MVYIMAHVKAMIFRHLDYCHVDIFTNQRKTHDFRDYIDLLQFFFVFSLKFCLPQVKIYIV